MATVRTSIALYDGVTAPLENMQRAMTIVLNTFEKMHDASDNAIDIEAINYARGELNKCTTEIYAVATAVEKASKRQEKFAQKTRQSKATTEILEKSTNGLAPSIEKASKQQEKMTQKIQQSKGATEDLERVENGLATSIERASRQRESLNGKIQQSEKANRDMLKPVKDLPPWINESAKKQQEYTEKIKGSETATSNLLNKVKGIAAGVGIGAGINKLVGLSDEMTSTNARLSLLVDDGGSVAVLEDKIMASAMRSRSAYSSVADAVAKLGSNAGGAFDHDMDQVVNFAELVNKQFVISGASAIEASNAMLQLTQAMGSGVLQGDELRSIFEQAPGLIQNIADYMGKPIGEIRQLASDGEITADIVKNAMFAAADDINAKFDEMPMTWSQVWTMFSNVALTLLQPLLSGINWLANNISIIGPLVLGLGSAFTIFLIAANWTKIAAAATAAWTAVQAAFNAVMAANPVILIVIGIILLISVIYAATAAYNKFTKNTVSATGIIVGALAVAGAFFVNLLVGIWNVAMSVFVAIYNLIATVANFLASVFTDPVGSVVRLFAGMADSVLNILSELASAIDAVFGSNLQSAVEGWRSSLSAKVETKFGKGNEVIAKLDATSLQLDRIDYGSAYRTGYNIGSNLSNKISDKLGITDTSMDLSGITNALDNSDLADAANKVANNTGSTAADTDDISKAIDLTNEDLKYLRDIAEREVVNRYTTAAITVHQTNHNTINSEMDLDGVTEHLRATMEEELAAVAEGVH